MRLSRLLRHLVWPDWWMLRAFPKPVLRTIEQAISQSERSHLGELRFVLEASLPVSALLHNQSSRARAIALFAQLGVWDTENNSGVLIYVQLNDRRVEIIADRGINVRVDAAFWSTLCRRMEKAFHEGGYESGVLLALNEITQVLTQNFPASEDNLGELPDAPLIV